jgi:VanZ family protein
VSRGSPDDPDGANLTAAMKIDRPRSRRIAALFVLIAALLVPLLVPIPTDLQQDPLVSPLADRAHVVLFAGLTLALDRWRRLRGRLVLLAGLGVVIGGLTELLQIAAGRSASLWDWFQDAQGVALALSWLAWRRMARRRAAGRRPAWRWAPVAAAAVVLLTIAWPLRDLPDAVREGRAALAAYPVLADFERPAAGVLWNEHLGGQPRRVARDDAGHALEITHTGEDRWPGASSRRLAWNWTGQDTLLVDARLVAPSPDSLRVTVWLEDRVSGHDVDDAHGTFTVGHGWTTLRLPLHELRTQHRGRELSLRTVSSVAVFMHRGKHDGRLALQIDDLRLRDGSLRNGG